MTAPSKITPLIALPSLLILVAMLAPAPAPWIAGPTPIDSLPFQINSSGVYCLTGDLLGNEGIIVNASNVEIDLNGFNLSGPGIGTDEDAIEHTPSVTKVRVHNGAIRAWGGTAVELGDFSVVEDLFIYECVTGINVASGSRVEDCFLNNIEDSAIEMDSQSTLRDCYVECSGTEDPAVIVADNSVIENLSVLGGSVGLFGGSDNCVSKCSAESFSEAGFRFLDRTSISHCRAQQRGKQGLAQGIELADYSRVEDSMVYDVSGRGIEAGKFCTIIGCKVNSTGKLGMEVDVGTTIEDCDVINTNTSVSGTSGGILAASDCSVLSSTVSHCSGTGIYMSGFGGQLIGNRIVGNSKYGIIMNDNALAQDNSLRLNTLAGIRVAGQDNALRDNLVDHNGTGLEIPGQRNLIVGNRVAQNIGDDYNVQWGNAIGPVQFADAQIGGSHPQLNYGRD